VAVEEGKWRPQLFTPYELSREYIQRKTLQKRKHRNKEQTTYI
jgi:hypothetical protein